MAGDAFHTVETARYTASILLDIDEADKTDDVDVFVDLPDGSRWMATFMTVDFIARVMRKWSLTDECLGGIFLNCPDLVIAGKPGLTPILQILEDLTEHHRLRDVFQELQRDGEDGWEQVERATPPVAVAERVQVVELEHVTVSFMLGDGDDPATVTDVGAVIELTDRSRWAARFMTLDAVARQLEHRPYFQDWNLVIVAEPGVPAMTELVRRQVTSDDEPVWRNYRRVGAGAVR